MVHSSWFRSWFCSWFDLWYMVHGIKTVLDNVLLDHGGLPCLLPITVHLNLGHPPDTQGYLGLLSEPCTPTQTL